jgi:hypothetical protein
MIAAPYAATAIGTSAALDESVGSDVVLASLTHGVTSVEASLAPESLVSIKSGAPIRTTSRIDMMTIDASSDAAYRSVWGGGR